MSHLSHHESNSEQLERRASARIPLRGIVKMGAPGGEPYATVSARDLSSGGLFIDADRPVKIGARFSAEIVIPGCDPLYVSEAEVTYNRENPSGAGFGVRFVDAPVSLVAAIECEIHKARAAAAGRVPSLPPVSVFEVLDSKTAIPAEAVEAKVDERTIDTAKIEERSEEENATEIFPRDTLPSEPMIGAFDDVESMAPQHARPAILEDLMRRSIDLKARVVERSRRVPLVWTSLAIAGTALVVSAIGLALWSGSRAEAVEVVAIEDRGVSSATHQTLMDEGRKLPDLVELPKAKHELAAGAVVNPLPELRTVEEPKKVEEPKVEPKIEEPMLTAAVAKPEVKKVEVVKTVSISKTESVKKAEPVKKVEAPKKVEPSKPVAKPAPKSSKLKIGLAANARVLKTHVLKAPDRFVIDVTGQDGAPAVPGVGGAIKAVRYGKHPEYTRIVIEATGPIANGRAAKNGKELSVTIELTK